MMKNEAMKIINQDLNFKASIIEESPINDEEMTISFLALSTKPIIKRNSAFGEYYISINTDKVNFKAKNLYLDHNPTFENSIGVITECKKDKEGFKVKVRFFEHIPASKEAYERYKVGLSNSVSVGFGECQILEEKDIEGMPHFKIEEGDIVELSAVWRGADPKAVISTFAKEIEMENKNQIQGENMENQIQNTGEEMNTQTQNTQNNSENTYTYKEEAQEIAKLAEIFGNKDLALQAIAQGKSYADFRDELYAKKDEVKSFSIKTSKAETPKFSITNVITGKIGIENDYRRDMGRFSIPDSFYKQFEESNIYDNAGVDAIRSSLAGVKSIEPVSYRGDKFIELIRNQSPLLSMLDTMPDLTGEQQIPRDDTEMDAYFIEEGQTTKGQGVSFSDIKLTPHTLSAKVKITRKMLQMTPFALDSFILKKMVLAIKTKAEKTLLYGDTPIKGIFNLDGTAVVKNFLKAPEYKGALEFKGKLWSHDYDTANCAFVCNSLEFIKLEGTPKFINKTNITETERTLLENGKMAGFNVIMNNLMSDGDIVLADFSNVIMGLWSNGVEFKTYEVEGGTTIIECFYDLDFNYKRNNAFVISNTK